MSSGYRERERIYRMKVEISWPGVIVISWNEKGFPQAKYYGERSTDGLTDMELPPDGYMTAGIGESQTDFVGRVRETWPGVDIEYAIGDDELCDHAITEREIPDGE